MPNISALANASSAATSLSNLILVTPQKNFGIKPQYAPSRTGKAYQVDLNPILFHYEGQQSVTLESDVTDFTVEDNSSIQDHIALRPESVTTNGYIGELNDIAPDVLAPLKVIADKLTIIDAYTPALSAAALIAYNEAVFLYSVGANALNSAVQAWSSINGDGGESVINGSGIKVQPNQNKQQVAFQKFYGYWKNRTLFTVQTPWAIFQDMVIRSLRAIQDEQTNVITDFEVTFKLIRFASTVTEKPTGPITINDPTSFQGRSADHATGLRDLGTSNPPLAPISFSSAYSGSTVGV